MGRDCRNDPTFRRIPVKGYMSLQLDDRRVTNIYPSRIESMAKQLDRIQRGLSAEKGEFPSPVASEAPQVVSQTHTSLVTSRVFNLHEIDENGSQVSPQHIGSIRLDGREITSLFNLCVPSLPDRSPLSLEAK